MSDFNLAFFEVISKPGSDEGGYVNNPKDPGGETKFGISKRSYPNVDIKNLTLNQAKEIYKYDWWDKYLYGQIEDQDIATKLFSFSINLGAHIAHQLIQSALASCLKDKIRIDGILGDQTVKAINKANPFWLIAELKIKAITRYIKLYERDPDRNETFIVGWILRALR